MSSSRPIPSRSQTLAFSAGSLDPLDFPSLMRQRSSSPDSGSSSQDSRPSTPSSLDGYETILSLEREFCTNFSCCGLVLPDMHALVDHFEETHVLVIGADGQPVYPVPDAARRVRTIDGLAASPYAQLAPHSTRHSTQAPVASVVVNYPQPNPPATPSAYHRPGSPFAAHTSTDGFATKPDMSYLDAMDTYDPFGFASGMDVDMDVDQPSDTSSAASSSPPAPPQADLPSIPAPTGRSEDACLPPSLLSRPSTSPPYSADSYESSPTPYTAPPSARSASTGYMPIQPLAISKVKSKPTTKRERRRDTREKMYKCPRPNCTKSYLNPNGLKYHIEKGTCTFALPSA